MLIALLRLFDRRVLFAWGTLTASISFLLWLGLADASAAMEMSRSRSTARSESFEVAVAAARSAFDDGPWRTMPAVERANLMRRLGELLTRDAEELAVIESRDNGKIIREILA